MKNIHQLKLAKVDKADLIRYLFSSEEISDYKGKYSFRILTLEKVPFDLFQGIDQFQVFNADNNLLGKITIHEINTTTIVTFEAMKDDDRHALSKYIKSIVEVMKSSGFNIENTREVVNVEIDSETDEVPYCPKTEAALKRWKKSYEIICEMRKEEVNPDDPDSLDLFIPKLEDFCERIRLELKISYCERQIRRIIKAGEAGLLK